MIPKHPYIYWIGFLLILAIFIFLKVPDLQLPYFWDELGVYAPGALRMKDTCIGLLPGHLEAVYSRGHPLLCYAAFATVFKLFGDTVFVGHCFALFIACFTLLVFFLFVKEVFSQITALISVAVLCVQPMFYAMSGIILPEMLLTCFSILAVWGLIKERWWLYITGCVLAMLTKEAGLILPATALVIVFATSLRQRDFFTGHRWKQVFLAMIPVLVFILFLIIQKVQQGWFFFPYHTGLMTKSVAKIIQKLIVIADMFFCGQGRWFVALAALILFAGVIIHPLSDKKVSRAIKISMLFIGLSIVFACLNYYLHRYLLPVMPFIIVTGVYFTDRLAAQLRRTFRWAILVVFTSIALYLGWTHQNPGRFADTNDMSYRRLVLCQRDCMRWAEQQPWSNTVPVANFPVSAGMNDKRTGYLLAKNNWPFAIEISDTTLYGIFYLQDGHLPDVKGRPYKVLRRFQQIDATFVVIEFVH